MNFGPGKAPAATPGDVSMGQPTPPDTDTGFTPSPGDEPPKNYANRLVGISKVHPWMPPQAQATIAAVQAPDVVVASMAAALRKAYGSVDNTYKFMTHDPLLQKDPSLALAVHSYLSNTIGPWPISDQNIVDIQNNLARMGYGAGTNGQKLPTNGAWSTDWNHAYNQYLDAQRTAQLGGQQTGSKPVSGVLGWFSDVMPREAFKPIAAWISRMPDEGAHALKAIAGQFAASTEILTENPLGNNNNARKNRWAARAENALPYGAHITPQTAESALPLRTQVMDGVSILGDMLILHGLLGAAGTVAQAAGETSLRGLTWSEASRGPGVIARSILDNSNDVPRGMFTNIPILKYASPAVGKIIGGPGVVEGETLADQLAGKGLYYKARTLLATPYAYGPVRVAGTAIGQLGVAGAKTRAVGNIESKIGGQTSALQAATDKFQKIDYYDAMLRRLTYNASGGHVALGLDSLAWVLHPPLSGVGQVSAGVGQDITNTTDMLHRAIGPYNSLAAHIENGVNTVREDSKYLTHDDIIREFGSPENYLEAMSTEVRRAASVHAAELLISKMSPTELQDRLDSLGVMSGDDDVLNQVSNEVMGDSNRLVQAMAEMIASGSPLKNKFGGSTELSKRLAASIDNSGLGSLQWVRQQARRVQASRIVRQSIIPREEELLHEDQMIDRAPSPQVRSVTNQLGSTTAEPPTPEGPGGFGAPPTPSVRGKIGLADSGYVTKDEALDAITAIRQKYDAAAGQERRIDRATGMMVEGPRGDMQARANAVIELQDYLEKTFGINARAMPSTDEQLFALANAKASRLARALFVPTDASGELRRAMDQIADLGFRPIVGNNVGHDIYEAPLLDVMSGATTRARRTANRLGMSPESIPTVDHGFTYGLLAHREIENSVEAGRLHYAPYDDANGILSTLRDDGILPHEQGFGSTANRLLHSRRYKADLAQVTAQLRAKGVANPELIAKNRLEKAIDAPLGIWNIRERDVIRSLTREIGDVSNQNKDAAVMRKLESEGVAPRLDNTGAGSIALYHPKWYTEDEAREVFRALQRAKTKMPVRLTGIQHVEDLANLPLGFAGRHMPGWSGKMAESLPSAFQRLRAQFRWTFSPEFSARRVIKTGLKTSLDGVPFTFTPRQTMEKLGITKSAFAERARILPETENKYYEEGADSLYAGDIWFYNHADWEAWAVHNWVNQGLTDTEIRQRYIKDFGYGSAAHGEGRSSLEKTGNFIFFPLSFDKTLYRNVGAHLLDHPAQRMMLTAGLAAYHKLNDDHPNGNFIGTSSWFQKHIPVAQEALRLNAFAHGIGLGEFGGLNAPLLNLFIPQSYNVAPKAVQTIQGFIPMLRELEEYVGESKQQFTIGVQWAKNLTSHATGGTSKVDIARENVFQPQPVAETTEAQLTDAYLYRTQLKSMLSSYIDYNAHHTTKYKLGTDASFGNFGGDAINATLVNKLVHAKYPAFAVDEPPIFYDVSNAAVGAYSDKMKAAGRPDIVEWIAESGKYYTYSENHPGYSMAADTAVFRRYAIKYAETVPGFLNFYNQYFRYEWGPLEQVKVP
jgi:hypothetical protein